MKRIHWLVLVALLPACAHLGLGSPGARERIRQWNEAHQALYAGDFARAGALFSRLAAEHPDTDEGRESLLYVGAIQLDPRNPAWDPEPAESTLRRYLALDSARAGTIHRRPEATVLFQLAHQLNLPAEARVPGLQPETRVVTRVERVPQRVVVPARQSRALAAEAERLREQLAERDATIRQLREELERIRKTLTKQK